MKIFRTLCLAVVLIGLQLASSAQSAGNYLYGTSSVSTDKVPILINTSNGSTVNLKAEVMMNVKASSYTVIFAMTQSGADAFEVDSIMGMRLRHIRMGLAQLGISDADIHVDAVSVVPTYEYRIERKRFSTTSTEIPTGFEMKKNIHVLFKKHDLLDKIISEMAYANVYDMVKVEYNIDGAQTYYEELRKAALSVIETKKETYSQLQFHLVSYNVADGFNVSYPMERYKSYTAFHSGASPYMVSMVTADLDASLDKAQRTAQLDKLNREFTIQTSEKNKTIFYDRMPYNQFDKVLNSDVAEPCIQFFYTLQVGYTIMTDEQYKISEENKVLNKQNQRYAGMTKKQIRRLKKLENGKL